MTRIKIKSKIRILLIFGMKACFLGMMLFIFPIFSKLFIKSFFKTKELIEKDSLSATSLYFNTNWSYTPRKLEVNEGLFGDSLGERANETAGNRWSFGLGFRNQIHKNIQPK